MKGVRVGSVYSAVITPMGAEYSLVCAVVYYKTVNPDDNNNNNNNYYYYY